MLINLLMCNSLCVLARVARSLPSTDLVLKPGTLTWTPPFVSSPVERSECGLPCRVGLSFSFGMEQMLHCGGGAQSMLSLHLEVEPTKSEMNARILPGLRTLMGHFLFLAGVLGVAT